MSFEKEVYKAFKPIINKLILPMYSDLEPALKKARMKYTLEEYLGLSFFSSLVVGFILAFIGAFFVMLIAMKLKNNKILIAAIPVGITFFMIGFTLGVLLFRGYPYSVAASRAKKINNTLYLATIYMATIAGSGTHPITMFELLAKYKEFGEISKEAQDILYYVKGLGVDFPTALELKAKYSPSNEWADLLQEMKSIIVEGGDLEAFLMEKAKLYVMEYKRKISEYVATLQVFLELYITVVIVGVIFILILTSLMGSMMGGNVEAIKQMQIAIVLFLLPLSSIMFIVLIKSISPFEM